MLNSVKVLIDKGALETLTSSEFNLCLTRDVKSGGKIFKGNVVFAMVPTKQLEPEVALEWEDKYQVFETKSYEGGVKVLSDTQLADLKLGQKATFDGRGVGHVIGEENLNKPLTVRNDWEEDAHVGVRSYDLKTQTYNSLFLSPKVLTEMTCEVTPINKFSIFWHQYLETDTIIDDTVSDAFEFEFPGAGITLKYSKNKPHWSL